jgi:glycosyltransferase involved in cell wall biosynthesis
MTTAVVVSRFFPYNAERVHGVYQRLGTQIEALARVVDRVECLFLVPLEQNSDPSTIRGHEERLRRLWSPAISLKLAATVDDAVPQGRWQRIGRGIFDFRAQLLARPTSTAASLVAVAGALSVRPDIVLVHRLESMYPLMEVARRAPQTLHGVSVFLDMDDIEHVALRRHLLHDPAWPAQRLLLLQLPALILAERRAMQLTTATFVCSEADRRSLTRLTSAQVETVPNSVSFPAPQDDDASELMVLFVGAMGYRPNAQAADSLVQEIWPLIHAAVPPARMVIVGPGREHTISYHSPTPGVTFTGFVEDLKSWYRRARVVCCPIHHGGGTRVKIIEAAAYAKAVVSTRMGAEGLEFEDGREIILRDSPVDFANSCIRLLREPRKAADLGRAARERARRTYERSAVVRKLESIFLRGHAARSRRLIPARDR